ncbi:uncharacterized protein LOC135208718 [Macrobrachium nipponense]|uniref:uncharacterized protein LOC135208718 n=1 Tax=Macrobrachium nipponense TaxID=159736 RepID=UPI0030C7B29C
MSATQLAYSLRLYEENCKDLCTTAVDLIQRASDVESSTLETYRLRLESQIKKYEELNFKYLVQLGEEGFSEQDPDRTQLTTKRCHANQVITESTEVLEKLKIICMEAKPQRSIATEFRPWHKVKLPSLSLPEFEGTDGEWPPFWDVFESNVHSRPDLRAVDKFNYLKGCLKGEALTLIRNILVTNENYLDAIDLLKKTYANPEKIISSLICQLAGLPKPSADLDSLRGFWTKLEQYVRGIERNKPNSDHCTWTLGPLVFQKLPGKVKEQIQNKCGQDYPSLLDIREGLGKIILTLSSLDFEPRDKSKDYSHRKPKPNQSSNRPGNQTKTQVSSYTPKKNEVTNLSISVTPGQPNKTARTQSCVFCDRPEHKAYQCDIYKTTQERISRLTAKNRCVKCTSPNHKTTDCLVKFHKCLSCKTGLHHSALCPDSSTEVSAVNYCGDNDSDKDLKSQTSGILPTALMKVVCPPTGNTKELRSLFDSGAQRTFITQEAVEECKLVRDNPVQLSISGFWDTKEPREYSTVTVPVRVNDDSLVTLKAIVVPKLPQSARPRGLCKIVSELKSQNVTLADPNLSSSQIDQVKLLVGIDHYFDFIHSPQANRVNLIESP